MVRSILFAAFHPINECYNIGAYSITCNKCKFLQTKILHVQRQTTIKFFYLTRTLEVVPGNTMPAFKKEQKRWDKQANHNYNQS